MGFMRRAKIQTANGRVGKENVFSNLVPTRLARANKKAVRVDGFGWMKKSGYFFFVVVLASLTFSVAFLRLICFWRRVALIVLLYCFPISVFTLFAICDFVLAL